MQHSCSNQDTQENGPSVGESEGKYGYLKSQCDRQRQSFSRDFFIETHRLNGNGVAGSVLAISNEDYHEPRSILLKNANAEDVTAATVCSKMSRKKTDNILSVVKKRQHKYYKTDDEECRVTQLYNVSKYYDNIKKQWEDTNSVYGGHQLENDVIINLSVKLYESTDQYVQQKSVNLLKCSTGSKDVSKFTKYGGNLTKVTILNEVLQSPWRPRVPNQYKPYRKTCCDLNLWQQTEDNKVKEEKTFNFMNNNSNITTSDLRSNIFETPENDAWKQFSSDSVSKCNFCEQVFTNSDNFDAHLKQHTGSHYTCLECYKSFSQLRNFKYHMSVHRGTKEFATICPVCGKFFNDKGYLSSHMKIHRNRKEYKCSTCPKSFNQRVAYNMHVRIHTGVKPHVCDECGKAFSRKMLLKQHQRTHSGERPYACTHCDKRFADRSNMTLHLKLHTGVKPFTCTLCPKSFTKKHHLKAHLNFHTGAKPYSCPRCKIAFTQSSNMRTHLKKCNALQIIENNVIKTINII